MATIGPLLRHVIYFHVIFNTQSLCSPGRPKTPVGRPRWTSEYSGDVATGLLPYLIVFVIFPVSLVLFCICAKHAIKWCTRQMSTHHHFRTSPNSISGTGSFLAQGQSVRTISGSRHSYSDLSYLSGFYSFLPGSRQSNMAVGSGNGSWPSLIGRRNQWTDDPPPNYPVEEPPPTYESLFQAKKLDDDKT